MEGMVDVECWFSVPVLDASLISIALYSLLLLFDLRW